MPQNTSRERITRYVCSGVTLCVVFCLFSQLFLAMIDPSEGLGKYLPFLSAFGVFCAWWRFQTRIVRRFVFRLADAPPGDQPTPLSGVWSGFWEQGRLGRQPMSPLELRFEAGHVYGTGLDCVGPFTFEGSFGQGEVRLLKKYLRRHTVVYVGRFDPAGRVCGRWSIGWTTGAFELWPQAAV